MKKLMISIVAVMTAVCGYAQENKLEPEYIGQIAVLNADSTTTLLERESTTMKSKSSALYYLPVPGSSLLYKNKDYLTIEGKESKTKLQKGKLVFVARAERNDVDPKTLFGVIKLEVKKNKRQWKWGEYTATGGSGMKVLASDLDFETKKLGQASYEITVEIAEPGQYAFMTADFRSMSTFGVE